MALNITLKQYKIIKLVAVAILAVMGGRAVVWGNYVTPLLGMVFIFVVLLYLRGHVKEVMADERDHQIAGRAASLAVQFFSLFMVAVTVILYANRSINPAYGIAASLLSYSLCLLLVFFTAFYYFLKKYGKSN